VSALGHHQGTPWGRLVRLRDRLYQAGRFRDGDRVAYEIRRLQSRFAPNPDLIRAYELLDTEYERLYEVMSRGVGSGLSGEGGGSGSAGHSAPTEVIGGAILRLWTIDVEIEKVLERWSRPRATTPGTNGAAKQTDYRVSDAQLNARAAVDLDATP